MVIGNGLIYFYLTCKIRIGNAAHERAKVCPVYQTIYEISCNFVEERLDKNILLSTGITVNNVYVSEHAAMQNFTTAKGKNGQLTLVCFLYILFIIIMYDIICYSAPVMYRHKHLLV